MPGLPSSGSFAGVRTASGGSAASPALELVLDGLDSGAAEKAVMALADWGVWSPFNSRAADAVSVARSLSCPLHAASAPSNGAQAIHSAGVRNDRVLKAERKRLRRKIRSITKMRTNPAVIGVSSRGANNRCLKAAGAGPFTLGKDR
jgi:hypothetical protein